MWRVKTDQAKKDQHGDVDETMESWPLNSYPWWTKRCQTCGMIHEWQYRKGSGRKKKHQRPHCIIREEYI